MSFVNSAGNSADSGVSRVQIWRNIATRKLGGQFKPLEGREDNTDDANRKDDSTSSSFGQTIRRSEDVMGPLWLIPDHPAPGPCGVEPI